MIGAGPLANPKLPLHLLRILLVAAALALTAVWLTRLTAPRPVAPLPASPASAPAASQVAAMKVFGLAGQAADIAGIELTGLYAAGAGGLGFATFRSPRGPLSGNAGDEIQPGVRLYQVGNDHVVLVVDGVEHRLELPARPAVSLNPATPDLP